MWLATFSREPCTKSVHNLKFYTLFAKLRNLTHWLGWHSNFVELFIHSILENFFVFHSIRFASRINIEYRRSRWRQVMHVILMGDHCPYDFCCFIVYALIVVICKWTEHRERERKKTKKIWWISNKKRWFNLIVRKSNKCSRSHSHFRDNKNI